MIIIQMMNYQGPTQSPDGAGEMHTVMIGLISSIQRSLFIGRNGEPQAQIQVLGSDAAKVFIRGMVTYFSFVGASLLGVQEFVPAAVFNAPPDQVIALLLDRIYRQILRLQVRGPGGPLSFWDLFGYRLETFSGPIPAGMDNAFLYGEGTFWSFFAKIASPPFHEIFLDTRRTQKLFDIELQEAKAPVFTMGQDASAPVLFLRPAPFPVAEVLSLMPQTIRSKATGAEVPLLAPVDLTINYQAWNELTTYEVDREGMVGEDGVRESLTRSDHEQYNVYQLFGQYAVLGQIMQILNVAPIVDVEKLWTYGYKPMIANTWLVSGDDGADWKTFHTALMWRLAGWHCLNDQFLSGQKTFKLMPHVHIGGRLRDRSSGRPFLFYIERVIHEFIQNERATTTLGLTRGLPEDGPDGYANYQGMVRASQLGLPEKADKLMQLYRTQMELGQKAPQ